jgi:hypothetical protein
MAHGAHIAVAGERAEPILCVHVGVDLVLAVLPAPRLGVREIGERRRLRRPKPFTYKLLAHTLQAADAECDMGGGP